MSSSTNLVNTMAVVQKYLYQFACPVLIFFGIGSCILNLIVFTQKNLRKNPCSIYFIAYNLSNFLYINASLLSLTLNVGYNIDPSSQNLVICRIRLYINLLCNSLSSSYLILAFIDRILITSSNAHTRQRSTRRFAYICVVLGILFWVLFHIHALILTNIIQIGPNSFLCYFQAGVYITFLGYYGLIKESTALLLLAICGLWSIWNIRNVRRVRPNPDLSISRTIAGTIPHSTASKDRQLMLMLLMDIIIYILCSCSYTSFLMYQQITQNDVKSVERIQIENIVRNLCLFCSGIQYSVSCYANLIVSTTFRNEVKKVFSLL